MNKKAGLKKLNALSKSKIDKDHLDVGNGGTNDIDLIDMDQDDIGNEENERIQQKFNAPGSNGCQEEVLREIDN